MILIAKDIDGNEHEVDESEISWRVHAYAVIIDGDKILLSPQHGDKYDLPGGKIELAESVEEGLVREVKEESGIDVSVHKLLGIEDIVFKVTFREPQEVWHSIMLYYACEKTGGEISIDGFDKYELEYARPAEWVELSRLSDIVPASSVDFRKYITQAHSS
ncbi:MAG: NUDIX domain-containing protein [Candidatus Saccharimonadales bacterium]